MSQNYPPYSQPPQGYNAYNPYSDPLARCKRAGLLMFISGGLLMAGGLCCSAVSTVDFSKLGDPQQIQKIQGYQQRLAQAGMTFNALFLGFGIVCLVPGLLTLIFAIPVRRGSRASIIVSIILSGLAGLVAALLILCGLVSLATEGADAIPGLLIFLTSLALFIFQIYYLVRAYPEAAQAPAVQAYYQQQLAQAYYQQQAYQQQQPPQAYAPQPPMQQQAQGYGSPVYYAQPQQQAPQQQGQAPWSQGGSLAGFPPPPPGQGPIAPPLPPMTPSPPQQPPSPPAPPRDPHQGGSSDGSNSSAG